MSGELLEGGGFCGLLLRILIHFSRFAVSGGELFKSVGHRVTDRLESLAEAAQLDDHLPDLVVGPDTSHFHVLLEGLLDRLPPSDFVLGLGVDQFLELQQVGLGIGGQRL